METSDKIIWFKRKWHGYGWTPSTWQGWLVVVIYIVGLLKISESLFLANGARSLTNFFVGVSIWTILLLIIAYRTGENPRWRWGKDKDLTSDHDTK